MASGTKRAALVWHRRAGKDLLLLNFTITQAAQRVGVYWHVFPTAKQGRKILWDGVTKDGRLFLDHWPRSMIASRNESEMKIKTREGSVWQIVGSDNYTEALIGGKVALTAYADFVQPAIITYGQLPTCGAAAAKPLCKDAGAWVKLKTADAAATSSILAAKDVLEGASADTGQIARAVADINAAQAAFKQARGV